MSISHQDTTLKSLGVKRIDPLAGKDEIIRLNRMCSSSNEEQLTDYGGQKRQGDHFWLFEPRTKEEAVLGLTRASQLKLDVTIRGSGHSMNGSSIPQKNGLLLLTTSLNKVVLTSDGKIEAEAGAQLLVVDDYIGQFGLKLPIVNDGGVPAPTVGGFICAGGFGVCSKDYGGFWNHIRSLEYWTPKEGVRCITQETEEFWQICASGKPKGVILSASLMTLGQYTGTRVEATLQFKYVVHPNRIWFTFIAPIRKSASLRRALIRLDRDLRQYWEGLPPYEYMIKSQGRGTPDGFYPEHDGSLAAMGVWGEVTTKTAQNIDAIMERVSAFTNRETYAKRYWQSEL
jgi:FAD/FMN-containing dehydrogenase